MFKFSAESHIWKKYIQKLNAWDLSLRFFQRPRVVVKCQYTMIFKQSK